MNDKKPASLPFPGRFDDFEFVRPFLQGEHRLVYLSVGREFSSAERTRCIAICAVAVFAYCVHCYMTSEAEPAADF